MPPVLTYILSSSILIILPNLPFSLKHPAPFSSELIRTFSVKIKPSEDPEVKALISYISWTKAELWAIVKDPSQSNQSPS